MCETCIELVESTCSSQMAEMLSRKLSEGMITPPLLSAYSKHDFISVTVHSKSMIEMMLTPFV